MYFDLRSHRVLIRRKRSPFHTNFVPLLARHKIVVERGAFPSDQYAVRSQIKVHGYDPDSALIELRARPGEFCVRDEDVDELIDREGDAISLILLGGVNYATGQAFDMQRITTIG